MAANPLGFGIIGAGTISGFHAQAIAQLTGARLVGVASRSAKGKELANKHGVFSTTDPAALLDPAWRMS